MHILFLTPMPQEVDPLLKSGVITERYPLFPDLTLYSGKLGEHDLSVGLLGIGKVNAAYATTQYITITKPDTIVLFGSAGGLHDAVEHGTLYAAQHTWTHDYGTQEPARFVRWEPGVLPVGDIPVVPLKRVVAHSIQQAITLRHPEVRWASVVSGDSFLNNSDAARRLFDEGADLVDMESSVVADLAARFNIPSLILRVVSDKADDEAQADFASTLEKVCEKATPHLIAIMHSLTKPAPYSPRPEV